MTRYRARTRYVEATSLRFPLTLESGVRIESGEWLVIEADGSQHRYSVSEFAAQFEALRYDDEGDGDDEPQDA